MWECHRMKMQIDGQSVRLRINEAEWGHLHATGEVEDSTRFSSTFEQLRRLRLGDLDIPMIESSPGLFSVVLPRAGFEAFAAERPRRDGFAFEWIETGAGALSVSIEIDVRDSHRQRSEERRRS